MATPGTKWSARLVSTPTFASTVVVMRDGRFLEVRRGEKTHWASGEPRGRWASLEEWMSTLPVGTNVTTWTVKQTEPKKTGPKPKKEPLRLPPADPSRFHPLFTDPRVKAIGTTLCLTKSPYQRTVEKHEAYRQFAICQYSYGTQSWNDAMTHLRYLEEQMKTESLVSESFRLNKKMNGMYAEDTNGDLCQIYVNQEYGLFGRQQEERILYGQTLEEIGLSASARLWIKESGSHVFKKLML
jgi:hypothetical protein